MTKRIGLYLLLALLAFMLSAQSARAEHVPASRAMMKDHGPRLVMPMMDPDRGRKLFVSKGCVA